MSKRKRSYPTKSRPPVLQLSSSSESVDDDEFFFEIDFIINEEKKKKEIFYHVKWKDYSFKDSTWEPSSSLPEESIIEWQNSRFFQ